MSDVAISVHDLGKRYRIGKVQHYHTFRDTVASALVSPWRRMRHMMRGDASSDGASDVIWALRDVSFDVNPGDVVGVIGRNGAGKSTLLKILTRITDPTEGYADIAGRVGSLLEVGTGFHPELTGRENIYLNGAILGMSKVEIRDKFDQIVSFAAVERFIDTPVKHFSSGMYLRLAFAVAAHLEPEILLVDEVLAVGDASFQKKCLGRMEEVAHAGRTILFVSHNMGAVRSLCTKGIYLEDGRLEYMGDVNECIQRYFQAIGAFQSEKDEEVSQESSRTGFGRVTLKGGDANTILQSQSFRAATQFRVCDDMSGFYLFCILEDMQGRTIFHLQEASPDLGIKEVVPGEYQIEVAIPPLWLIPGLYSLYFKAIVWGGSGSRYVSDKFPVDIQGTSTSTQSTHCFLHPEGQWKIESKAVAAV